MGRIIIPTRSVPQCIYCREPVGRIRAGEHVIPNSIGGTRCLDCVCGKCNSSFSPVEKELVSRSPLAILVQQVLGTPGAFTWGYDPALDIALEARPLPGFKGPPLWPQLVLMGEKAIFTFDHDEARQVGVPTFVGAFRRCLAAALTSVIERPKRPHWIWERVRVAPDRGRYPPRVFTEHAFTDFRPGITFKCRYVGTVEPGRIFHQVRNWQASKRHRMEVRTGEPNLRCHHSYRCDWVLRALTKIGINLLAWIAGPKAVNCERFSAAMGYITGEQPYQLSPNTSGFIDNEDIRALQCPPGCHRFWLLHDGRRWHCDCAFFDGRLGARVTFPGPEVGPWRWAEVTAPMAAECEWTAKTSKIGIPRRVRIVWLNEERLMPSVPQRKRPAEVSQ